MTTIKCPRPPFRPRAGSGVTSLFLAGLAVSGAVGMLITPASLRPAAAQTVANPNDQPTPATVPSNDGTAPATRPTGQVATPSAISSGTVITAAGAKQGARTNPLDHLPAKDRAGTGGSRRD